MSRGESYKNKGSMRKHEKSESKMERRREYGTKKSSRKKK